MIKENNDRYIYTNIDQKEQGRLFFSFLNGLIQQLHSFKYSWKDMFRQLRKLGESYLKLTPMERTEVLKIFLKNMRIREGLCMEKSIQLLSR